jgi:lipopolysaccharide export system permease protein
MMRLPLILSLYIGRNFVFSVLGVLGIMLAIIGLVELLELIRRASDAPRGVPFFVILEMTLLKLPTTAEKIYPFGFLIGGMVTLSKLTRTSELVVARAAGVSVWQFLMPGIITALLMGLVFVGIMNPIAAATVSRYERMEGKYISAQASVLSISPSGLWLRQVGEQGIRFQDAVADEYILHALRMDQSSLTLQHVIIFLYREGQGFVGRIDADDAVLAPGQWTVHNAVLSRPGTVPEQMDSYVMPTQLTLSQIQDSFSAPETFSFWALPGFIQVLEKAGFSALRHRLHFYSLMAMPLLFAGMLMLAAVFSLRQTRRGRTGMMVVAGVASGFVLYFLTNLIYAMGGAGTLPVGLAAWAPSLIVVTVAGAALLHLEDG